ncbi:MAG: Ig-like domain-containing protein, partial [Rhodoferax sp.]|nr:Ig-like domain-containing protein [Rhodoferax sp.]
SSNGTIEAAGDRDWFAVALVAGQAYSFSLDGATGTALSDPLLTLFSSAGVQLGQDDDSGPGVNSLLTFTATQTGTHYLQASGFSSSTGSYRLAAATAVLPDSTAPLVQTFLPADGSVNVDPLTNIVLTFSEPIVRGTGSILLKTTQGVTVETFDAALSNRISISGNTLTIDPTSALLAVQGYTLSFGAGTIKDSAGNAFVDSGGYDWLTGAPASGPGSGRIELVSSNAQGVVGTAGTNSGDDSAPALSANGNFVVFNSWAGNLIAGDTNANHDTFFKSMGSGAIRYVTTNSAGDSPSKVEQYGTFFSMSADGRYVAFSTTANNLVDIGYQGNPDIAGGGGINNSTIVSGDNNTASDIYVKDMFTGTIVLASSTAAGLSGNNVGASGNVNSLPAMSADGQRVAFTSYNNMLVSGDTNSAADIFIKTLGSGAVTRVSTTSTGAQATGGFSDQASFSADGQYLVFSSTATNLVAGDTNGLWDVFRKNLVTGEVVRVSTTSSGAQTTDSPDTHDASVHPSVSRDGRYVLFESTAKNLVPGDTDVYLNAFRKDLQTGEIQRIAANLGASAGSDANASMSDDGRYVVFTTYDELVTLPFRHDYGPDVFVQDMQTGEVRIVSAFPLDVAPTSLNGRISADGRQVVMKSTYKMTPDTSGYQIYRLANPFLEQSATVSTTLSSAEVTLNLTGNADADGTGNALENSLSGNGGRNRLLGGEGNDTLRGGAGNDTLDGGGGFDQADYSRATTPVTAELWRAYALQDGQGGQDSLVSIESVLGSPFADLLAGAGNGELLDGGAGNDGIYAAGGQDTLIGGAGVDTLDGGAGVDTADYSAAPAGVTAELWRSYALNDGHGAQDALWNIEVLIGSDYADLLAGGANDEAFVGGSGADGVYAAGGNDTLAGGTGRDTLDGGAGFDTADYSAATGSVTAELWRSFALNDGHGSQDALWNIEALIGSAQADLLAGASANESFRGGAGNDGIYAAGGQDTLEGGPGRDTLDGGEGLDLVDYGRASASVTAELWRSFALDDGQGGQDALWNIEHLSGSAQADLLAGTNGNNRLWGQGGADQLYGADGQDTLAGGPGNDTLYGGAGSDVFVFDATPGAGNIDLLPDFNVTDDTLQLTASVFAVLAAPGALVAGALRSAPGTVSAADANDYLIYNSSTGALYYDADGNGAQPALQFAVLGVGLALSVADFTVL